MYTCVYLCYLVCMYIFRGTQSCHFQTCPLVSFILLHYTCCIPFSYCRISCFELNSKRGWGRQWQFWLLSEFFYCSVLSHQCIRIFYVNYNLLSLTVHEYYNYFVLDRFLSALYIVIYFQGIIYRYVYLIFVVEIKYQIYLEQNWNIKICLS